MSLVASYLFCRAQSVANSSRNNALNRKQVPIRRPIFILGLPRTGSTLLQRLLALDTNNRGGFEQASYLYPCDCCAIGIQWRLEFLRKLVCVCSLLIAFQLWELMQPVPPPRPESYDSDWRKGCLRQSQWCCAHPGVES